MTDLIACYGFDKIERDDLGCHWGYIGNDFCEVYLKSEDDTEEDLMEKGFALCDAPGTETMLVEVSAYQALKP